MRNDIKIHRQKLIEFLNAVQATDQRGNMLLVEEAIENAINIILEQADFQEMRLDLLLGNFDPPLVWEIPKDQEHYDACCERHGS